jgi:CubicO group peptidase (beta-lactamase class C family)
MISGMKFPILLLIAGPALAVGCTGQDHRRGGVETGEDNAAVDAVFAPWNSPGAPGCALAVARDGALLYSRGFGYANLDYEIPITPQTVFDVGSVTKQFTAACITLLALEGKLSLDDNVREWLPELPEYESPITLRPTWQQSRRTSLSFVRPRWTRDFIPESERPSASAASPCVLPSSSVSSSAGS